MQSRINDCIKRNELREGKEKIPNNAIAMTSNKLQLPSWDEGFDELYFVAIKGEDMIVSKWEE